MLKRFKMISLKYGLSFCLGSLSSLFWAVLTWQAGGKYAVPCAKLGAVSVFD
jgi:hypothetical protein